MRKLEADELFLRCDPDRFAFSDTSELDEIDEIVGQDRAVSAIRFGIEIEQEGYNLFAMGPSGIGKHHVVSEYIRRRSFEQPVPRSWIYVHNFDDERSPLAIALAPGRAAAAKADLDSLMNEVEVAVQAVFESEDFRARRRAIHHEFDRRQELALQAINEAGRDDGIVLVQSPDGLSLSAVKDGELLAPEELDELPSEERDRIDAARDELGKELRATLDEFPRWERERRKAVSKLERESVEAAIDELFADVKEEFTDSEAFVAHLEKIRTTLVENPEVFLSEDDEDGPRLPFARPSSGPPGRHTFAVNVLVDHCDADEGAPVVYEDDPTVENLFGRIEYESEYGALSTNHMLIRAGSMHEANGGYLVVDARKLLSNPQSWEQLKRALYARQLRVDSARDTGFAPNTLSLTPDAIPLYVKVVLVGERDTYYALRELDPDMDELFKVMADFETEMDRNDTSIDTYVGLVATLTRRNDLRPLDPTAVARVIEHGSRIASDTQKLTTHMRTVADLLREADYWSAQADEVIVTAAHVQQAIDQQEERNGRIRDALADQVHDGTVVIRTTGEQIGEVNGLSVIHFGPSAFGRPTRLSATVSLGSGEVIDIEREVDLGGPIHSKGIMLLRGFLGSRFAQDHPLSLSANIVFEQSYGGVDGDSASAAETCALLSAIAEIPLKQSIAMTGAIDQRGNVLAVGGVNEKIEGFFDICTERGMDGAQGVIIPQSNVSHLMLRSDVVDAVAAGEFGVWSVEHVDEALELLTGHNIDEVNAAIRERLAEFAGRLREFRSPVSNSN